MSVPFMIMRAGRMRRANQTRALRPRPGCCCSSPVPPTVVSTTESRSTVDTGAEFDLE